MGNHPNKIRKWLYPISFLYGIGVRIRNKMFDWKILKQREYPIPLISIGNITVGGTGKTPHTEYLIDILQEHYKVAVLSRGYKRKTKGFVLATQDTTVEEIGDEPFQIKQKFPKTIVAVDAKRRNGVAKLLQLEDKPDLILLDDAFQHRYVKPGLNILLTDYHRLICDDKLLPAGLLREPISGKYRANIVIVTKCTEEVKPIDINIVTKRLDLYPFQKLYFSEFDYGSLYPIFSSDEKKNKIERSQLKQFDNLLLVAGIANPQPLISELTKHNAEISCLVYKDHHQFSTKDIEEINKRYDSLDGNNNLIVTTEKDAMRLLSCKGLNDSVKDNIYALPVEVKILQDKETLFNKNIYDYVKEDTRNS